MDNGTGIAVLSLLSILLAGYCGDFRIELAALNGEDHCAAPGQMAYLAANQDVFDQITLIINIDGVGYTQSETAISFFGLSTDIEALAVTALFDVPDTCEGIAWLQGDHSMFIRSGRPAIAVTSNWLLQNMVTQTITHTSHNSIDVAEVKKAVSCTVSVKRFIAETAVAV